MFCVASHVRLQEDRWKKTSEALLTCYWSVQAELNRFKMTVELLPTMKIAEEQNT